MLVIIAIIIYCAGFIMIKDFQTRQIAIDPTQSFIVQAPAGSGKTELLMQRILTLLLTVKEPEQIMALTFTKKAVEEMRHRVIQTLQNAALNTPVESDHQQQTRQLALKVLEHANQFQWHLLEQPKPTQHSYSRCAKLENLPRRFGTNIIAVRY